MVPAGAARQRQGERPRREHEGVCPERRQRHRRCVNADPGFVNTALMFIAFTTCFTVGLSIIFAWLFRSHPGQRAAGHAARFGQRRHRLRTNNGAPAGDGLRRIRRAGCDHHHRYPRAARLSSKDGGRPKQVNVQGGSIARVCSLLNYALSPGHYPGPRVDALRWASLRWV
jgi:hypothetical protein